MASNSGWTTGLPSGNSLVANTDEEFRSLKSFQEAWWEQEHYATSGSATSAGVHKQGSARAYVSSTAPASPVAPAGQLWVDTDDDGLYYHDGSSWVLMTNSITLGSSQSWTGVQQFMAGSLDSQGAQLAPNRAYLQFTEVDVASSASAQCSRWGTPQTGELANQYQMGRAGSITGITAFFNANITAGLVDVEIASADPGDAAYTISAFTLALDSSTASRPTTGAGHTASATTAPSLYTFAAGAWLVAYAAGDGSLSPSGSGDVDVVVEVTYDD